MDINMLSPLTFSFVGDVYFSLLVRTKLAEVNRPVSQLHSASVKLVNAKAQAEAFKLIENDLTEKEMAIYKRGRNAKVGSVPKNASSSDYHSATGLEALFGYLHLLGENERAEELFNKLWDNFSDIL